MIPAGARITVEWLDPAALRPWPAQPLDLSRIAHYVELMSEDSNAEGHLAPPMVNAGSFDIRDGRHRWAAHLVMGRKRIRCLVVHPHS